jgi:hypothetical protein
MPANNRLSGRLAFGGAQAPAVESERYSYSMGQRLLKVLGIGLQIIGALALIGIITFAVVLWFWPWPKLTM